jgi:hypothetical protein
MLVQIALDPAGDDLRLRRLSCGKALLPRRAPFPEEPPPGRLKGCAGEEVSCGACGKPEAFRKSGRQSRAEHSIGFPNWTGAMPRLRDRQIAA